MLYTSVWLQEKWDWREDLVFVYQINKNKQADEISGWLTGVVYSATSSCFDLFGRYCRVTLFGQADDSTVVLPLFGLFICSQLQTPAPENTTSGEKMIGWKINLFFITENFLGILDRICAERMRKSHDFLSLTLAFIGSTSISCYYLL